SGERERPARTPLPLGGASVPATPRANPTAPASSAPATPRSSLAAPVSSAPTTPMTAPNPGASAHGQGPEPAQALALRHTIEVAVVRRDERGRVLLHGAGVTFVVETRLELPVGARLQLAIATSPAGAQPPFGSGPLEAVRELGAALREEASAAEAAPVPPRLPQADASLAARLLRLLQLIGERAAATGLHTAPEPGGAEAKPDAPRIAAALAELGRLAGEPQSGGWRGFLLPLGLEGEPLLRLYLREEPLAEDGYEERRHGRPPASRRAVFELEFGELGRTQIDVLCRAERFDLSLRTERALDAPLRREIREFYLAARDAAGLAGELRFLVGAWTALPEPGSPRAGITV